MRIGGQTVPAGYYSILSIPSPEEWVVIINADTTLYSGHRYDSKKDVARFIVRPTQTDRYYESLTFDIDIIPNNAKIYIAWEHTQISFEVLTEADRQLMDFIDSSLLTRKEKDGLHYANSAEYLYFLDTRLQEALVLCDIAYEKHKEGADYSKGFLLPLKMRIYEKLHLYTQAIEMVDKAIAMERSDQEIKWLNSHKERIESKK